jgi:hypothetical protein
MPARVLGRIVVDDLRFWRLAWDSLFAKLCLGQVVFRRTTVVAPASDPAGNNGIDFFSHRAPMPIHGWRHPRNTAICVWFCRSRVRAAPPAKARSERMVALSHYPDIPPFQGLATRGWRKGWDSNPRGSVNPLPVFKTGALNHSATLPIFWTDSALESVAFAENSCLLPICHHSVGGEGAHSSRRREGKNSTRTIHINSTILLLMLFVRRMS